MASHSPRGSHDEPAWPLVTHAEHPHSGREKVYVATIILLSSTVLVLSAALLTGWFNP